MFSGHMWVIIGAAIFLLGFVSFNIQLYQLIKLDAQARGMDHPEIWVLSASGRGGIVAGASAFRLCMRGGSLQFPSSWRRVGAR